MKIFLILSVVLLVVGTAVYSCGGNETASAPESEKPAGDAGAQLYNDNCVVCHGTDGAAGMSGATDLSASVLSHENTLGVIMNGRNGMRAFGSQFSKEELEAVTKYVESLRR